MNGQIRKPLRKHESHRRRTIPDIVIRADVQYADGVEELPTVRAFDRWLSVIELPSIAHAEVSIRIVGEEESAQLNLQYRGKHGPTNVLSFPMQVQIETNTLLLGDLVICAPVMRAEVERSGCSEASHWAHLTIHGVLHLQGYDHDTDEQAQIMEALEVNLLHQLGYSNPYHQETP